MAKKFGRRSGQIPPEMEIWKRGRQGHRRGHAEQGGSRDRDRRAGAIRKAARTRPPRNAARARTPSPRLDKIAEAYKAGRSRFQEAGRALPKDFDTKIRPRSEEVRRPEGELRPEPKPDPRRDRGSSRSEGQGRARATNDRSANRPRNFRHQEHVAADARPAKTDAFQFDEPQGKILRRLRDGIVEIDIGSTATVQPGLTFTVLPQRLPREGPAVADRAVPRSPTSGACTRTSSGSSRRRRSR